MPDTGRARPKWLTSAVAFLRAREAWLPAVLSVLVCLVILRGAHLPFFSPAVALNPKDEGYINAFAMRLRDGHWLPYVDAVSHRGPMLYWVAALATRLGDFMTFVPMRMLAMVCGLLIVALAFASAVAARRPLTAALAPIGIVAYLAVELLPDDGLAYNGEVLLDVFALASLLCLTVGLRGALSRRTFVWLGVAGVLAALGALSKQVGAVTCISLGLWPLVASLARTSKSDGSLGRRCAPFGAFAAGVLLALAIVLARYAAAGQLKTFYYYAITYNSKVYMAPYTTGSALHEYRRWVVDHLALVLGGVTLAGAGLLRSLSGARSEGVLRALDRRGFLLVVSASALLTAVVANGTLRNFAHYYVQVVPWFSLLLALLVEEALGLAEATGVSSVLTQAALLAPLLSLLALAVAPRIEEHRAAQSTRKATLEICKYVERHSNTDDRIFVWGFAADIYTYCRRAPGSRYVYSTFLSGYVPFVDDPRSVEQARVVPHGPELLMSDLEASRAALVLDVSSTLAGRSISETPLLSDYLGRKYCAPVLYDGVRVFSRRADDGSCPAP